MHTRYLGFSIVFFAAVGLAVCQESPTPAPPVEPNATNTQDLTKETQPGIPVTDRLTIEKCGGCHTADSHGNLSRISWIRTTPEGWEEAIKRMVELNGAQLKQDEARQIVRYLAADHGLSPEEVQPIRWYLEKTEPQTESYPDQTVRHACASCHAFARPQMWRRTPAEWQLLKNMHVGYFPLSQFVAFSTLGPEPPQNPQAPKPKEPGDVAMDYLSQNYGLYSSSWSNWHAQMTDPDLSGRWLLGANAVGKGKYFGEMTVTRIAPGQFTTSATLVSARDGSKLELPGKAFVYTGYEWRGGGTASGIGPVRQVMNLANDQSTLTGRWFWGTYQEFGFVVSARRESRDITVLGTDIDSIQSGSKNVAMKIYGEHFPSDLKPADIQLGSGLSVGKIVSANSTTVSVLADTESKVFAGRRGITIRSHTAPDAFSVYDRIEYIKINAETALAHVGGTVAKKGFVQYEAHAYANGLDGLPNTADDVDLGPVPVKWSIEEFISHNNDNDKEFVGFIDSNGLFTPAGDGPNPQRRLSADNVGDVWVVAKYAGKETAKPLETKSYLVIAIPDFLQFDTPEVGGQ
jgi:quinohemoprotein amine dehydrogenase